MMLDQLKKRQKLNESDITFVPGIFSDDVSKTNHPDLPKEWLAYPVSRLLAAHMQALRLFQTKIASMPDKDHHVMICMEDDVVLHKDFEDIVQKCATFLKAQQSPSRLSIGYVNPPVNISFVESVGNLTFSKLHSQKGDPWGTQGYMLNSTYVDAALEKYEKAYKAQPIPVVDETASDAFLYTIPDTQHFIVEPPACIEDNPTFGSMLGHSHNTQYYNEMIKKYDRSQYFMF